MAFRKFNNKLFISYFEQKIQIKNKGYISKSLGKFKKAS